MPAVDIIDAKNNKAGKVDLSDDVFGVKANSGLIHEAFVMQMANARQGTNETKTRHFVSGGGVKPFRQKGTGRARAGSSRSGLWRHGGVILGPHPRDYSYSMPKKAARLALAAVLSAKLRDGELIRPGQADVRGAEDQRGGGAYLLLGPHRHHHGADLRDGQERLPCGAQHSEREGMPGGEHKYLRPPEVQEPAFRQGVVGEAPGGALMKSVYEVIKKPLITEKGSKLKEKQNKIVLQVSTEANKIEIKNAVEAVFKVKVEEVRTMVFKGKKKRLGVRQGVRSDWKKAVVTLKEGQTVEYLEGVK